VDAKRIPISPGRIGHTRRPLRSLIMQPLRCRPVSVGVASLDDAIGKPAIEYQITDPTIEPRVSPPSTGGFLKGGLIRLRIEGNDARNALGHLPKQAAKRVFHILDDESTQR
jgi:hypothetical protein